MNWLKIVLIAIIVLKIVDFAETAVYLSATSVEVEVNPVARFLMQQFGVLGGLIAHSVIVVVPALFFIYWISQKQEKWKKKVKSTKNLNIINKIYFKMPNSLEITLIVVLIAVIKNMTVMLRYYGITS